MARFVVIDDFTDSVLALAAVADVLGHAALPLTSGKQVVELAKGYNANIVLTDIQMPDPDGFEVARLVRASLPDVLLVGISGGIAMQLHPDVALFDMFFQKPLGAEEMMRIAQIADDRPIGGEEHQQ